MSLRRRGGRDRGDRGITLIELAIAILVLSLGTVAALRSLDQSRRGIGEEPERFIARTVALNRAEELRLFGAAEAGRLPPEVSAGRHVWRIETDESLTASGLVAVTISVSAEGTPGARLVAHVSRRGLAR